MQDLADQTISDLHGVHFGIRAPARRIEAMIAPASGARPRPGPSYYRA
jgi:hypothetical protein